MIKTRIYTTIQIIKQIKQRNLKQRHLSPKFILLGKIEKSFVNSCFPLKINLSDCNMTFIKYIQEIYTFVLKKPLNNAVSQRKSLTRNRVQNSQRNFQATKTAIVKMKGVKLSLFHPFIQALFAMTPKKRRFIWKLCAFKKFVLGV